MAKFNYVRLSQLTYQLQRGPRDLRRRQIDRAEELIEKIDQAKEYPYEFVYHWVTSTQTPKSRRSAKPQMLSGRLLLADIPTLILVLSNSLNLKFSDLHEQAIALEDLASQHNVTTKTISRWRKRGLAARKVIFPNGRRRLAFLPSSLQRFTARHAEKLLDSARFQRLSTTQREEIINQARQLYRQSTISAHQICVRLAHEHDRAVETIRTILRGHDKLRPVHPVFPPASARLSDEQKASLLSDFNERLPITQLCRRFRRSRSSIYRLVNEIRSRRLKAQNIEYVYNPQFDLPGFAQQIELENQSPPPAEPQPQPYPAQQLPEYLRSLSEVPLLTHEQEIRLFRRYNCCKFQADILRRQLGPYQNSTPLVEKIESLLNEAIEQKNRIIRANLRLVIAVAKRHLGPRAGFFELISDGNIALMRAVEKFDYSRRYRFSTYATWIISRDYARTVPEANYQLTHYITGRDEMLDVAADGRGDGELLRPEVLAQKDLLLDILQGLEPRERHILTAHFGLGQDQKNQSLETIGKSLGLSKERVRQIETQALRKLRQLLTPQKPNHH